MEFITIQKNLQNSPRKLRLVADMVRKMDPYQALDTLQFTSNAAANPLLKAIKTVLANAGRKEGLSFKSIEINEGLKMKRYRVGTAGRGRGRPYKKRLSHIKIILTDEVKVKSTGKKPKVEEKIVKAVEGKVIE
jgi:large subunit ribosomal protein L22